MRLSGTLVNDETLAVKEEFLNRNPGLKSMYKADDDKGATRLKSVLGWAPGRAANHQCHSPFLLILCTRKESQFLICTSNKEELIIVPSLRVRLGTIISLK